MDFTVIEQPPKPINGNCIFGTASKDKAIEPLKRRIQNLTEENKQLKRNNEILLGKLSQNRI